MISPGSLLVVGLGPGDRALMTEQALQALRQAQVVIGYAGYLAGIENLLAGKECLALPLGQERERACRAVGLAQEGQRVCVVSSGDPGVYAMASLVLEVLEELDTDRRPEVAVIPGVSAVQACAALFGAPLGHDFAVISLSDLLTPWEKIERRLRAAAAADFVVALLNPKSQRRDWQLQRALEVFLQSRAAQTPVGVVRNAYRPDQSVVLTTIAGMADVPVDMFTTVVVGNSCTRRFRDLLITPRGYAACGLARSATKPADILKESFRIIDEEIGPHSFGADEWPIVRRMIHASGDMEIVGSVDFRNDAVAAGLAALREGVPLVTDVSMVAAGFNKQLLQTLQLSVHCFIEHAEVRRLAEESELTRSRCAMARAIAEFPEAIYVVGNAPTALLALCEAVLQGLARPRLVVAMPVGFVAVGESKEAALALAVPAIVVRGRKGGSAMAAAAVNALLHLAMETQP